MKRCLEAASRLAVDLSIHFDVVDNLLPVKKGVVARMYWRDEYFASIYEHANDEPNKIRVCSPEHPLTGVSLETDDELSEELVKLLKPFVQKERQRLDAILEFLERIKEHSPYRLAV